MPSQTGENTGANDRGCSDRQALTRAEVTQAATVLGCVMIFVLNSEGR
jgi:hypothetical protein